MSTDSLLHATGAAEMRSSVSDSRRLMITKIVLEDFKSYGGVQEVGPFHKSFTSIVGPNGSGKSNVIDALLFVFGRPARQLRLNRVSELIHKSDNYNPDSAKVSVFFQTITDNVNSPDEYEVVPGSSFSISRIALRNNTSRYCIDDKSCQANDVKDLLQRHGVDLDNNRFLILQGEVEQIALMKPKAPNQHEEGMLEHLESIIGSDKYVPQIQDSTLEVERLNGERADKIVRARAAESDREGLSQARQEAEDFIHKEREIRVLKNSLYQIELVDCNKSLDDLKGKQEAAQERFDATSNNLLESEEELKAMQQTYTEASEVYNKISSKFQKISDNFAEFDKRDVLLREEGKHLKQKLKKLMATKAKENSKVAEYESTIAELTRKLDAENASLNSLTESKAVEDEELDKLNNNLREQTSPLRDELTVKQEELRPVASEVSSFTLRCESIRTEITLLEESTSRSQQQLHDAQGRLAGMDGEEDGMRRQLSLAEDEVKSMESTKRRRESDLRSNQQEEVNVSGQLNDAIGRLEEAKSALSAVDASSSNIASIIMDACRSRDGPLSNTCVCGRLGDLGEVDAQYDIAVSTAAGSSLDYIVVETSSDGVACMNYLRENNLGRATFIALDQLEASSSRMNRDIVTPEGIPRLISLISVSEERYRPAFYLALRDTLLADTIDTAVRIAYDGDRCKWRTVTLNGELIDSSGSLSGGGKEVKRGMMMIKGSAVAKKTKKKKHGDDNDDERRVDVSKLERVVIQLEARMKELESAKNGFEDEINQLTTNIHKLINSTIPKLRLNLSGSTDTRNALSSLVISLTGKLELSTDDKKKMKKYQKELTSTESEIESRRPLLTEIELQVKSIQQRIMDIGGVKVRRQQDKLERLVTMIDETSRLMQEQQVEIASNRKTLTKSTKTMIETESDITECNDKLEEISSSFSQLESDAAIVFREMEQAKIVCKEKEAEILDTRRDFEKMKAETSSKRQIHYDNKMLLDDVMRSISDVKKRMMAVSEDVTNLRREHEEDLRENQELLKPAGCLSSKINHQEEEKKKMTNDDDDDDVVVRRSRRTRRANDDDDDSAEVDLGDFNSPLADIQSSTLRHMKKEELKSRLSIAEDEKNLLSKKVNICALDEYKRKDKEFKERMEVLEQVTRQRDDKKTSLNGLKRQRLTDFLAGFTLIALKLKEMYQMITFGGDAELELVDSLDPFSEGIVFSVRPPKKSWKNISNLSGGEKTLASLALVFALHHYKPTALYVMDEIDAALDFRNVSIVANYIKERTRNAQFVIISLRNNMFELADRLVGIYKTDNITHSVSVNPNALARSLMNGSEQEMAAIEEEEAEIVPVVAADTRRVKQVEVEAIGNVDENERVPRRRKRKEEI